ncbi:MAG: AMP-binding protein, partial [Rhodospirillaceae bacterium]|nr:AMP-binding protein [Rhodospirillaceae bacterium]
MNAFTIDALLATAAPENQALGAPDRISMTYRDLREQVDATVIALNGAGVGRGDRVAIVLPNGPEMASAFVAIGAGATTAPLNPAYRADEFRFYLDDLGARLLVVERGSDSDAVAVARELGMGIAELFVPEGAPAGRFELEIVEEPAASDALQTGRAQADDIALVLHTSGTTSR